MGVWTPWEFYEAFGGWPDDDDHQIVPPIEAADAIRDERKENPWACRFCPHISSNIGEASEHLAENHTRRKID